MNSDKFLGFRWWCHLTKKMRYVTFSDILKNNNLPHYGSCDFTVMRPYWVVEKDGEIIYEGDILLWSEYQGWEDGRTFYGIYVVQWDDNEQKFRLLDPFSGDYWDAYDTAFDEVIGNIYENPNLLPPDEKEKDAKLE